MRVTVPINFSRSQPAPAFEAAKNKWKPQLHFTGVTELPELQWLGDLLRRHEVGVVSHYFYCPLPGVYSLELQFGDTEKDRCLMKACRAEYLDSFTDDGKLKMSIRKRFE
jgi:hypothetical protein